MAVKAVFYGMTVVMAATAYGAAEARVDSRIDEAAREIVAARMGNLRGGFGPDEEPFFVGQGIGQKEREPLKVLQYGRYRDNPRIAPQDRKTR